MIDSHTVPTSDWGLRPILFEIYGIEIPSYGFFVLLGIISGFAVYYYGLNKSKSQNENSYLIAIAALIGGALGAKIPIWISNFPLIVKNNFSPTLILSGRTIIGGLVGGMLGVFIMKKFLKIKEKRGNQFAPGVLLGMAIGRIGCLLRGCCYGVETHTHFGIDFGDGILRHPTQVYEAGFDLIFLFLVIIYRKKFTQPGSMLRFVFTGYFIFRFFLEFIKVETQMVGGFTIYQIYIPVILIFLYRHTLINRIRKIYNGNNGRDPYES